MACWAVDPLIRLSVWFVVDAVGCDQAMCLSSGEAHSEWLWFVWWKTGFYIRFVRLARRAGFISSDKLSSRSFFVFLVSSFFVIVGSIVVLLSFYCRFIVFYCRSTVILLSFHGRSIVNLLVVLCFPLLFFVFLGFAFFIFVFCLCLSFVKSRCHSRYHRFVIIGRYRSDVITLSLSCRFYRVFLCRFPLTFFLEFLVVFLDCGWYVVSYCVTGFIIVIIVLLFLLGCECLVAFGG